MEIFHVIYVDEHDQPVNMYTATIKNRSCTRKASTAVKVSNINAAMAEHCDKVLAKDAAKAERQSRRAGFKAKRQAKSAE